MPEPLLHHWKRVLNVGRWRIAFIGGGRYRFGFRRSAGKYDCGLGLVVISAIRRHRHGR